MVVVADLRMVGGWVEIVKRENDVHLRSDSRVPRASFTEA